MDAPLGQVTLDELQALVEGAEPFVLVDALSPTSFAHSRLPGAVNVPAGQVDELAPRRIRDRAAPVVVYCASEECEDSVVVGRRLLELGYRSVRHFAGGKRAWVDAGLPLEGGGGRRGYSPGRTSPLS